MNVYQQYKREQLALKIQKDIQADIAEEKRIKEAEIRMREEARLNRIAEAKKNKEVKIICYVVTLVMLALAKLIADNLIILLLPFLLIAILQMLLFGANLFR